MDLPTYIPICVGCVLAVLGIGGACTCICTWKRRRDYDQVRHNSDVEKKEYMKQTARVLDSLKIEMEKQMDDVKCQLEEVDKKKKENKEKLQNVEKELKEGEDSHGKQEEQAEREKELVHNEWKLDAEKKTLEKQQSDLNKLKDLVEPELARLSGILNREAEQKSEEINRSPP